MLQEIYLCCCTMHSGRSLLMFQRCLLPPSSGWWWTTYCNNPDVSHLHIRHCENLKSHRYILLCIYFTEASSENLTPLIPKYAIGRKPEPVLSTSHPHKLSCQDLAQCYPPIFLVFYVARFSLSSWFYLHVQPMVAC
jgi:hypothetical protein